MLMKGRGGGVGGAGWLRCGCGFCKRMCNTFLYSPAGSQPLIILNLFTYAAASTCVYILVCVCVCLSLHVCVCVSEKCKFQHNQASLTTKLAVPV